jgi:PPOX class probable F420-dependent enzyme
VVFARDGADLVTAIDGKPKKRTTLARIENISRDPRVTLLAHHYDEDWSKLWWVRVDGSATVESGGDDFERALDALRSRYPQYGRVDLGGPVIRIGVERAVRWGSG